MSNDIGKKGINAVVGIDVEIGMTLRGVWAEAEAEAAARHRRSPTL